MLVVYILYYVYFPIAINDNKRFIFIFVSTKLSAKTDVSSS